MSSTGILPLEIYGIIADYVDRSQGLAEFRLAHRALLDLSLPHFCQRFRHRRFVVTEKSLQALVEIARHPSFGPRLEVVSLGTYRLTRRIQPHTSEFPSIDPRDVVMDAIVYRQKTRALIQHNFIDSGRHIDLLTQAFTSLREHRSEVEIGLFDDFLPHGSQHQMIRGYGSVRFYSAMPLDLVTHCPADTLRALTTAANTSGINISCIRLELALSLYNMAREQRIAHYHFDYELLRLLRPQPGILTRDTSINLISGGSRAYLDLSKGHVQLRSEIRPKEFWSVGFPVFDHYFQYSLRHILDTKFLSKITLNDCAISSDEFIRLVVSQANTLRVLELSSICLIYREPPRDFDFWYSLQDLAFLEELKMSYVMIYWYNIAHESFYTVEEQVLCEGRDSVRGYIQGAIAVLEAGDGDDELEVELENELESELDLDPDLDVDELDLEGLNLERDAEHRELD